MNRLLFIILIAVFHDMVLINGQCTIPKCRDSTGEAIKELKVVSNRVQENLQYIRSRDEIILKKLEEHDQRLQAMNQTLSSGFQSKNESAVNTMETSQMTNGNLPSAIDKLNEKMNAILYRFNGDIQYALAQGQCESESDVCDCSEIRAMGFNLSGMYRLNVFHQRKRHYFFAYCDMTNGSWTVFQRRKDGSVNFYRGWSDYANGFGNPKEEFWLGNEFLHLLTSKRSYRLRIDVEDFEKVARFEEYTTFRIASSVDKYRLTAGGYSGNTSGYFGMSSGLGYDTGKQFTTKDSDNDGWTGGNSAVLERGAWWYSNTIRLSNLNGIYLGGIDWREFGGKSYSLKTTELKISSSDS